MKYIGIDLGGINTAAALISENGDILKKRSVPTPRTPEGVADAIADHVKALSEKESGIAPCVGIGAPGSIDPENGIIEYWSNLHFHDVPLADMVKKRTGFPALMENDANCAALGEFVAGAGKGSRSLVVITLGTGIGGGAILNGKLYTGLNGAGLEVGHMVIEQRGRQCTCGRRGCFETYCSATALIRQARETMETDKTSLLWSLAGERDKVNGKLVFDAFERGDGTAKAVVEEFLDYLGSGVTSLINVFQPEVFCIGGGLAGAGETIMAPIRATAEKETYAGQDKQHTRLVRAELGNDAGIIGSALLPKYRPVKEKE